MGVTLHHPILNPFAQPMTMSVVADPKYLKRGGAEDNQLRPHLSQMRTTKYMPFTRKKSGFLKNMSQGGGGCPL